jgi:hypothetical protein
MPFILLGNNQECIELSLIVYLTYSQDEEEQLMHLKLMGWRHFPVNIEKLSRTRVLLLGSRTLGCEVACLLTVSALFISIPAPCHKT